MPGRHSDQGLSARHRIERAEAIAERDLEQAVAHVREVFAEAELPDAVCAMGHRLLAIDQLRRGQAAAAGEEIAAALTAAERAGEADLLGRTLMTAMAVAASTGESERALSYADRAEPLLPRTQRARLAIQRGSVLVAGFSATEKAIEVFDRVLEQYPDLDGPELGALLLNRGTLLLRRGDLPAAAADNERAAQTFAAIENRRLETAARLHHAVAAARMGDLPTVFSIHHELDARGLWSSTDPHDALDLAQCLVIAGLLEEAADLAERAVSHGEPTSVSEFDVQVQLLRAQIGARLGRRSAADAIARALSAAHALGSETLIAVAEVEAAAASIPGVAVSDGDLSRAEATLRREGHRRDAVEAAIQLARRGVAADALSLRRRHPDLPPVTADLSPFDRAQVRHLRALRRCAAGDHAGARRELAIGIRDIERARAAIAAADVRAAAGDRAPAMAAFGLDLAIRSGRPRAVLEWAERVRATSLRLANPVRRQTRELQRDLDELRRTLGHDAARSSELERRIAARDRMHRDDGSVVRISSARSICEILGPDRVLVEFLEVDGQLWRCTVVRQRVSVEALDAEVATLTDDVGKVLFGLRRMASRTGATAESAAALVQESGRRLATRIGLDQLPDASEVVIVPTGPLHNLPWAALPALADRPFVVAPSAHVWCAARRQDVGGNGVLVATGPGLESVEPEARQIGERWGIGDEPMVDVSSRELRAALSGRSVAHLCCHGKFRTDSPQFSALELADGPFTIFDLELVTDLPNLIVLSACSLGSVDVRLGDDLLGFPAAMFARGVSSLIAAVLPVPDAATRPLMVELHTHLSAGSSPAEALRAARAAVQHQGSAHAAAAASFLCFGKG